MPTGFGLSPTEARQGEAPKYIGVATEARREFRETTPVAPTEGATRTAVLDRCTETDARRESQYLVN
jgi:hypothetical protein